MNIAKFTREEFKASKPKLGRSLSMSVLAICLTVIALVFGGSIETTVSILLIGLGLSWVAWPMHFFLGLAMKSDRYSYKDESLVLPKMEHAEITHNQDGSISGCGKLHK